jgi:hypothetical protein
VTKNAGRMLRTVLIGFSCAAGGSVGYARGGPALALTGLMAVTIVVVIFAVISSAMLGRGEARSPFERLVVVLCIFTGRRPKDYLTPVISQRQPTRTIDAEVSAAALLEGTASPRCLRRND